MGLTVIDSRKWQSCAFALALFAGCSSSDGPGAGGAGSGGKGEAGGAAGSAGGAHEAGPGGSDAGPTDDGATLDAIDGAADDISDAIDEMAPPAPATLSATGFFKSIGTDGGIVLGDGVRPYEPRYKLWSDGADKTRWFYLPPGTKIDNSDQDHWKFPAGAKFWKEFSIGGQRIETRLVYHYGPGQDDYLYATYWWKPTDAGATPADPELVPPNKGISNANGTDHDVPLELQCHTCHDPLRDHVLGFSAFQLTPAPAADAGTTGVTIKTLSNEMLLTVPTPNGFEMPGKDLVTRNALGYMHANCGNCHNDTPGVAIPDPRMVLRVLVGQKTAEETGAYTTALNVAVTKPDHMPDPLAYRIYGGSTTLSSMSYRMALRSMIDGIMAQDQMPQLATEHPDSMGIAAVNAWIMTLPPPMDK